MDAHLSFSCIQPCNGQAKERQSMLDLNGTRGSGFLLFDTRIGEVLLCGLVYYSVFTYQTTTHTVSGASPSTVNVIVGKGAHGRIE